MRQPEDTIIVWTLDPDTGGRHSEGRYPLAEAADKQLDIQIAGYSCRLSQTRLMRANQPDRNHKLAKARKERQHA